MLDGTGYELLCSGSSGVGWSAETAPEATLVTVSLLRCTCLLVPMMLYRNDPSVHPLLPRCTYDSILGAHPLLRWFIESLR